MTPALRMAGACVAAAALAILMTWPLAAGLGRLGRITTMDGLWSIWSTTWVARTIVADPVNLYNANIFHPHRRALAFSEANIVAGLAAAPAWWLTRNPFTAHNTALLFAFASTVLGMWLLARRLSGDSAAAGVAAIVFAFCPYFLSHSAHIQLLMAGGIPIALARAAPPRGRAVAAPRRRARPRAGGAGAGLCLLRDLRRDDGRLRRAVSRRQPRPVARPALLERRRDRRRHLDRSSSCRSSCPYVRAAARARASRDRSTTRGGIRRRGRAIWRRRRTRTVPCSRSRGAWAGESAR